MVIVTELFKLQDLNYKSFHEKLIPNVDADTVIGVRTPELKKFARLIKGDSCNEFLDSFPHVYYEENNLHVFIINDIKDFNVCIKRIEKFLPYVDNWATCDGLRPKCFSKNKEKLLTYIDKWLKDSKTYTVRFGIEMLMTHFLDEDFDEKYLELVCNVVSDEYYVNMMIAWYFATALAKQYDKAVVFLEECRLSVWVHNKAIQKSVESFRISDKEKLYLKGLRRKI